VVDVQTAPAALRVTGLRVRYGSKVAVDGINLEVREGEIFGLLGPNGAGKTSALSAIEGLLEPDAGDIRIGEVDARKHALRAKAQLGVQLQATSFHSDLTLLEIVRLYAGLYEVSLSSPRIRDRLAEINLQEEASKRFRELSGGQQQRFSLLIASTIPRSFSSTSQPPGSTHRPAGSCGTVSSAFARKVAASC